MAYEHEHKYFIFQVKAEFEQYPYPLDVLSAVLGDVELAKKVDSALDDWLNTPVYTRKEYAVLGCSCGNVIKKPVQEQV